MPDSETQQAEPCPVVWTVERIGLYFYNGIDNRWAKYYENADVATETFTAEGKYRTNFIRLLQTMRKVLATKHSDEETGEKPRLSVPSLTYPGNRTKISIPAELAQDRKPYWEGYLRKCKELLKRDGVDDWALEEKIDELAKNGSADFTGSDLWNLAPTLPIARDWDIHGTLHPMSTSSYKLTPDEYHERFFNYQLRFTNQDEKGEHSPLKKAVYLNLVGNWKKGVEEVAVEPGRKAYLNDLRNRKDFSYFDLAKGIAEKKHHPIHEKQEAMSKAEADAYRAYAALTDTIQQKGEDLSPPVGGSSNDKVVYYANIPVIAAGYNHYFELTVSPSGSLRSEKGQSIEPIEDCYSSFTNAFIKGNERLMLKESLRELLVQLRLAAFEYHVTQYMVDHSALIHKSPRPNEWAVKCFCSLAPMINEMRVIHASGIGLWAHAFVKKSKKKGEEEQEAFDMDEVLKPWTEISKSSQLEDTAEAVFSEEVKRPIYERVIGLKRSAYCLATIDEKETGVARCTIEMWLFHNTADTAFNLACFAGTNEQRLREQFDWVRQRMLRFWSAGHP